MQQGANLLFEIILVAAVFAIVLFVLLVGLFLVWSEWFGKLRRGPLPSWRKALAACGAIALTAQSILLFLLLPLSRHVDTLITLTPAFPAIFVLSMALLAFGVGRFRWIGILCSTTLGVFSFFAVLGLIAR